MSKTWSIALKATLIFMMCIGVVFLSSCGTRNCNTQEFLTNSLCK